MKPKSARRRSLRRKYKRYAAAVAGAAILTGAVLPGLPVAKVFASEAPPTTAPNQTTQTTMVDNDTHKSLRTIIFEKARETWENRHRNRAGYQESTTSIRELPNPVDTVKDYALAYGFNAEKDTFTFLNLSSREASIQVAKHDTGERFRVELERNRRSDWAIVAVYRIY